MSEAQEENGSKVPNRLAERLARVANLFLVINITRLQFLSSTYKPWASLHIHIYGLLFDIFFASGQGALRQWFLKQKVEIKDSFKNRKNKKTIGRWEKRRNKNK